MANYETLKSAIQQVVKTNGNNEITGALLQQSLLAIINSLGAGYQYMGIATPNTNPGTIDQKAFYLAATAGTYTNFGGLVLTNKLSILKYSTSWSVDELDVANGSEFDLLKSSNELDWGELSNDAQMSSTLDMWNIIKGDFKAGQKLLVSNILADGVVCVDGALIIFQGTQNTNIYIPNNAIDKEITLPYDSNDIRLYIYRKAVTTGGNCKFIIKGKFPIIEKKVNDLSIALNNTDNIVSALNYVLQIRKTDYVATIDTDIQNKYIEPSGSLVNLNGYRLSQTITLGVGQVIEFEAYAAAGNVAVLATLPIGATRYNALVIADETRQKKYSYTNNTGVNLDVVICWNIVTGIAVPNYSIIVTGPIGKLGDLSLLTTTEKSTLVGAINEINANVGGNKPTLFNGDDIHIFNKGICIGDSLTAGTFNYLSGGTTGNYINIAKYSYPTKLSEMLGIEIVNEGIGGYTSAEWYAAKQSADLSGFDFAIIQLGVNDWSRYGEWGQTSIDAFTNIINKLKNENNKIKIFVATIIPATAYGGRQAISQGIRDLVANINDPNVILLDMALYSNVGESSAYNCGHLSAYGYWRLAKDYYNYISWYINNNKNVFKQVQFIGTEYVYE